jgi:uncharacterized RDD family membrane protein YckC
MAGEEWYYGRGGQRLGPVSAAELRSLYERGEIGDADYVWTSSMADWAPAGQVRDRFMSASVESDPLAAAGIPRVNYDFDQPATLVRPVVMGSVGEYAGFWRRLGAYLIDFIILAVVSQVLRFLWAMVLGAPEVPVVSPEAPPEEQVAAALAALRASGPVSLVETLVNFLYFTFFEGSTLQATPGKLALGIRVTDTDGNRISYARAFGRTLGKIVSGMICLIGFIMIAFTERKQGLHDLIAGTLVVKR